MVFVSFFRCRFILFTEFRLYEQKVDCKQNYADYNAAICKVKHSKTKQLYFKIVYDQSATKQSVDQISQTAAQNQRQTHRHQL